MILPDPTRRDVLAATGAFREWWSTRIVSSQQDVMGAAAATAVAVLALIPIPVDSGDPVSMVAVPGAAAFGLARARRRLWE